MRRKDCLLCNTDNGCSLNFLFKSICWKTALEEMYLGNYPAWKVSFKWGKLRDSIHQQWNPTRPWNHPSFVTQAVSTPTLPPVYFTSFAFRSKNLMECFLSQSHLILKIESLFCWISAGLGKIFFSPSDIFSLGIQYAAYVQTVQVNYTKFVWAQSFLWYHNNVKAFSLFLNVTLDCYFRR